MPVIIEPPRAGEEAGPLWKRLAWFLAIALGALAATAAAAYALKLPIALLS